MRFLVLLAKPKIGNENGINKVMMMMMMKSEQQ